MTGPFDDCEFDEDERERQLAAVKALDEMDEDVTSWEAGWLESAIRRLRDEKLPLTPAMLTVLKSMCEKYDVEY